jgi:hypothetical protein
VFGYRNIHNKAIDNVSLKGKNPHSQATRFANSALH